MEKGVYKWKQEKYENLLYSFCDKPSVSLAEARTKSPPTCTRSTLTHSASKRFPTTLSSCALHRTIASQHRVDGGVEEVDAEGAHGSVCTGASKRKGGLTSGVAV